MQERLTQYRDKRAQAQSSRAIGAQHSTKPFSGARTLLSTRPLWSFPRLDFNHNDRDALLRHYQAFVLGSGAVREVALG
jgi:hypothetical protein